MMTLLSQLHLFGYILLVLLSCFSFAAEKISSREESSCIGPVQTNLKYNVDAYTAASVGLPGAQAEELLAEVIYIYIYSCLYFYIVTLFEGHLLRFELSRISGAQWILQIPRCRPVSKGIVA
jgi:hypothetical protein